MNKIIISDSEEITSYYYSYDLWNNVKIIRKASKIYVFELISDSFQNLYLNDTEIHQSESVVSIKFINNYFVLEYVDGSLYTIDSLGYQRLCIIYFDMKDV